MSKKTFSEQQLIDLVSLEDSKLHEVIGGGTVDISGNIPTFFYRLPIFSARSSKEPINISDSLTVEATSYISLEHLKLLEFILLRSNIVDKEVRASVPESLLVGEFNIDYRTNLYDLEKVNIVLTENKYTRRSISLFKRSRFDADTAIYYFTLSDEITYLYYTDYLFPCGKRRELLSLFDNRITALFVRFCLSMPMALSNGLRYEAIMRRGFDIDGFNEVTIKNDFLRHRDKLIEAGIAYDSYGKKFVYSKAYEKLKMPSIKQGDVSDKEKSKSVPQESGGTAKKSEYIDFETLELTPKLRNKALDMGVPAAEIEDLFIIFKNTYSQLPSKYKNETMAWRNFIKRERGEVQAVENRGAASNITYNEEMKAMVEKHGINSIDAVSMFTIFRNHYIGNNSKKSSWVPLWENWILRDKSRKTGTESSYKVKTHIENEFYLARLVSEEILKLLSNKGIEPHDVTSGRMVLSDITFSNYPIPPSMGKGEETLFGFADPKLQYEAVNRYLGSNRNNIKVAKD